MKTLDASFLSSAGGVYACFTTRLGGKSSAPFDTANLAFHVGDRYDDVIANHDLLSQSVGYERSDLVHMRQIHSDRITVVDESHTFDTPPECDALMTNRPGIPLMSMSADCTSTSPRTQLSGRSIFFSTAAPTSVSTCTASAPTVRSRGR